MSDPRWTASTTAATFRSLTQNVLSAAPQSGACTITGGRVEQYGRGPITATECRERSAVGYAEIDDAFRRAADEAMKDIVFGTELFYAGMLLRDADLEDIAHYFEYTADRWARYILGR